MKRYFLTAVLTLGLVTLAACQKSAEQAAVPAATSTASAVATIDGKLISSELFDAFSMARARKPASELTADQRKELLDQMINLQLTADAAVKSGLDKQPD